MHRIALVAAMAAAFLVSPAAAGESQQDGASEAKKDKMVCRRQVATGTVMPKRVCHTQSEWAAIEEASKKDLERTRDMERARSMTGISR